MTTASEIAPPSNGPVAHSAPDAATALPNARLGEELPVFCERCGYSLNGLPQSRCAHCTILQFHCPECGHHQPINTLRPAFQRILGRVRASLLVLVVFVMLNVVFWPLIGWMGMGIEWSYRRDYSGDRREIVPAILDIEMAVAFVIFGLAYGAVGRMMLLRWQRGWIVGTALAALVLAAVALGAHITSIDRDMKQSPFNADFLSAMAVGALCVVLAASLVWPIWVLLVNVFLPRPVAKAVLEWQRFRPARSSALARE